MSERITTGKTTGLETPVYFGNVLVGLIVLNPSGRQFMPIGNLFENRAYLDPDDLFYIAETLKRLNYVNEVSMAKLKKISIVSSDGKNELRTDWDNDRHHVVKIPGDSPEAVIHSLKKLEAILIQDIKDGNL